MGSLEASWRTTVAGHQRVSNATQEAVILAVKTQSRIGSAALAVGPDLLQELRFSAPMQHSVEILPTISELLKRHGHVPADLDQIHIAIGPGSFTGLRIAVTMAKAMHLANAVRIVTVDSLDVVAANVTDRPAIPAEGQDENHGTFVPDQIAALFDAKRGQFYASVYQRRAQNDRPDTDSTESGYRIPGPDNGLWPKILPHCLATAGGGL